MASELQIFLLLSREALRGQHRSSGGCLAELNWCRRAYVLQPADDELCGEEAAPAAGLLPSWELPLGGRLTRRTTMMRTAARSLFLSWDSQWRSALRKANEQSSADRGSVCFAAREAFACSTENGHEDDSLPNAAAGPFCCFGAGARGGKAAGGAALPSLRASGRSLATASRALAACRCTLELAAVMLLRETLRGLQSGSPAVANRVRSWEDDAHCLICFWPTPASAERTQR